MVAPPKREGLEPGDRVLDLHAVTRSGGMFAGLVVAPIAAAFVGRAWWECLIVAIAFAVVGFIVGGLVGRAAFRTPPGQTVVIKAGASAIGIAMRASLFGGFFVSAAGAIAAFCGAGLGEAAIALFAGLCVSSGTGWLAAIA
jgi:hypothetical protein